MNGDDDLTEVLTRNLNSRRSGGADFGGITVGEMAAAPQAAAAAGAAAARSAEKKPGSNSRSNGNSFTTGKVRNTHNAAAAVTGGSSSSNNNNRSKSAKVKKDASDAENRGARPKDKSLNSSSNRSSNSSNSSSKSAKVKKDHSNAENRGARPKDKRLNNGDSSSRKKILCTSDALNREHAFASNPDPRGKTEVWLHPSDLPAEYRGAEQEGVVKHKKKPVVK